MIKKLLSFTLLLAFLSFFSCDFDSISEDLGNGYELVWIDTKDNQSIYKEEEQVPGYVFSVGYNTEYIIAKQYPQKGDFYSEPNFSVTNYFIIDIKENAKGLKKGVIGPLSEAEFNRKMDEFKIKDRIKFTLVK
ncbi:DUF3997 domain-containing protein [Rufibacter hautae]|uniref:DUF3997 domain-containing protein n=1 Tax=Rufibacter hautae TaxID=2595005 RepID=A0A5B6TD85_9BACT|nr:DUF3997 domain-containing protein [Rufibacter hautae]KAA3436984.1 DUF3997 domain-containing protein [Rufibacter hautae]